ncbi:c-type cytochrome [Deefgea rivuli]|uniref:c-type cytochrome n=1 Tax=Deefgea rivuli TaxID=400948 RepID=UPI0004807A08|nr:c-type cytochrome [Deefgea rivuli]
MKVFACLIAAGYVLSAAATAAPMDDLLKAKNCMACHAVDRKIVGPAYKDVAAKYKGNKDAVTLLAAKIQKGGSGVWGAVPMPPNAVTQAEAKQMAAWILVQK